MLSIRRILPLIVAVAVLGVSACKSTTTTTAKAKPASGQVLSRSSGARGPFAEIENKVWQLVQIRIGEGSIYLDRQELKSHDLSDIYILQFTPDGISGRAAPNRYFSSYKDVEGHNFSLQPIVGTLMESNMNIGGLMEASYYWYLQRVTRWQANGNQLKLYAPNPQGAEIEMTFNS
jgi:hypothetical protein